jgi:hypothetical protein
MTAATVQFRHSPDNIVYIQVYNFSFSGTGLNDVSFRSNYYKPVNAVLEIDSVGTVDTFKLSIDGGNTWISTLNPITGYWQLNSYDTSILFASKTGHTLGDRWIAIGSQDGYQVEWFQTQEPDYNLPLTPPDIRNQTYYKEGVQFTPYYPIPCLVQQTGYTEYVTNGLWDDGDIYTSKKADYMSAYPQIVSFRGDGLDDLLCDGIFYLNPDSVTIKIDSTDTVDTFAVSFDDGATWDSTLNPITGVAQIILTTSFGNTVRITFASITGHTLNDQWSVFKTIIS